MRRAVRFAALLALVAAPCLAAQSNQSSQADQQNAAAAASTRTAPSPLVGSGLPALVLIAGAFAIIRRYRAR